MTKVQFQDERLQKAADEAKVAIEERIRSLDKVSHDIKQLEAYFEESGVCERVQIELDPDGVRTYAVGDPAIDSEFGGGPAEEICQYLAWEKLEGKERWRIMYIKTFREGSWDEVYSNLFYFEGEPKKLEHRPLIETPAEIRLRAGDVLPELFAAVAKNTSVSRLA